MNVTSSHNDDYLQLGPFFVGNIYFLVLNSVIHNWFVAPIYPRPRLTAIGKLPFEFLSRYFWKNVHLTLPILGFIFKFLRVVASCIRTGLVQGNNRRKTLRSSLG